MKDSILQKWQTHKRTSFISVCLIAICVFFSIMWKDTDLSSALASFGTLLVVMFPFRKLGDDVFRILLISVILATCSLGCISSQQEREIPFKSTWSKVGSYEAQ